MNAVFNTMMLSIYRACYALLVIRFINMLYHKIFLKTDYDFEHAKMYILAYYPNSGPGLLVFKSTTICPEMLAWFKVFRDRMQAMLKTGKIRLVTEAVPLGEVQLGVDAMVVMSKISDNLDRKYTSIDLADLLTESSKSFSAIQEKYAASA